jgi:fatty acid desaturase
MADNDSKGIAASRAALKADVLTAEEIKRWRRPLGWRVALDLSLIWLQIFLAIGLYLWFPHWSTFVLAFLLVAGGQHGLALANHEFVHFLVTPDHPKWNDFLGNWVFGAPILLPLPLVRRRHFVHHRVYSTDQDTKTMYRREWRGSNFFAEVLRNVSGYYGIRLLLDIRNRDRKEEAVGNEGTEPMSEIVPPIVVTHALLFAGFWAIGHPWLYFFLWLAPYFTVTQLLHVIRGTVEHRPLDSESGSSPDSGYFRGTPGPFVRTNNASPLERLFLCKINFCYHAEHHLWPQISYQYLPLVRQRLLERGVLEHPCIGYERTYTSTMLKHWRPPTTELADAQA